MTLVLSKSTSYEEPVRAFINGVHQMIPIPNDKETIRKQLSRSSFRGNYHPGLLGALRSVRGRRSARNAYILLLGQTGAGKSSTINFLFDNQRITATGESESETSRIMEFSALVPVPELGISNSEIRLIDTPGLGDTRGIENDAKFIASLSLYLKRHEDLSTAIPNIVLVVAKFDDNRIAGEASGFVRMLKGIKLLEDQLVDKEYSNIIIVLTHYMNAKKEVRKDPSSRYELVRDLVRNEGFPEPIIVIGGENEAEEKDLEEMNGYWVLPNGECYPYNMFQRIQQLTTEKDPVGEGIIRAAFQFPANLKVSLRAELGIEVGNDDDMYHKALHSLLDNQFSIKETPVSVKLARVWNNEINPALRKTFPGSLRVVQNAFQVRQIHDFDQLPNTPEAVVKLLKQIPQNEAILILLKRALKIVVPHLNMNYLVGHGYNVLEDVPLADSPFEFNDYKSSPLGYKIPVGLKCELINETDDVFVQTQSLKEYASRRFLDLDLPDEVLSEIPANVRPRSGYNVMEQVAARQTSITTVREHRMFRLSLEPDVKFTKEFAQLVTTLPKFSDQVHIRQLWKAAFDRYGTHIITSAFGGGSIETIVQEQHARQLIERSGGDLKRAMSCLIQYDGHVAAEAEGGAFGQMQSFNAFGVRFKGGNMKYHKSNLSEIDTDEVAATLDNWRDSLTIEPVMLETKMKLVPLSHYVGLVSAKSAQEMEAASTTLFKSPFRHRPHSAGDLAPPRRSNIPLPAKFGDRSSCLKAGTRILMADWTWKPVEAVAGGDTVLDMDLKPCSVIGANYFYLGDRSFYGFAEDSQFFTEVHIFVGPDMTLRVASVEALLGENPAFSQVDKVGGMDGEFEILALNNGTVLPRPCQLFVDPTVYPANTPVYFLEVDSPSGTYFANGFVSRHELPPFHLWPNTFECLQGMMLGRHVLGTILQTEFGRGTMGRFREIVDSIAEFLSQGFKRGELMLEGGANIDGKAEGNDARKNLDLVLRNRSLTAFGLLLYGKCGPVLCKYLDSEADGRLDFRTVNINEIRVFVSRILDGSFL